MAAQNLEENDTPTPVTDASTIRIVVEEARHIARNGDPDGRLERLRGLYPWLNYVQLPRREFPDPLQLTFDALLAELPDPRQLVVAGSESRSQHEPSERKQRTTSRTKKATRDGLHRKPRTARKTAAGGSR